MLPGFLPNPNADFFAGAVSARLLQVDTGLLPAVIVQDTIDSLLQEGMLLVALEYIPVRAALWKSTRSVLPMRQMPKQF